MKWYREIVGRLIPWFREPRLEEYLQIVKDLEDQATVASVRRALWEKHRIAITMEGVRIRIWELSCEKLITLYVPQSEIRSSKGWCQHYRLTEKRGKVGQ